MNHLRPLSDPPLTPSSGVGHTKRATHRGAVEGLHEPELQGAVQRLPGRGGHPSGQRQLAHPPQIALRPEDGRLHLVPPAGQSGLAFQDSDWLIQAGRGGGGEIGQSGSAFQPGPIS
eukprot:1190988-Prorocentrum_minimum.AAC.9